MVGIFILLNICHWAADYTQLSRPYMLAAKRLGSPLRPIIEHGVIHGLLMGFVSLFFVNIWTAIAVFLFQAVTHSGIDVLKGKMNVWFPALQNPANVYHWWVFGADQFLHQVAIIIISNYLW